MNVFSRKSFMLHYDALYKRKYKFILLFISQQNSALISSSTKTEHESVFLRFQFLLQQSRRGMKAEELQFQISYKFW